MQTGAIDLASIPGPMDLQATLESGQTFRWSRLDGRTYEDPAPSGGDAWYRTVQDGEVIEVRQTAAALEWRSTFDATETLSRRLRLDDDLASILKEVPEDEVVARAVERFAGMRLVREPFWETLVSFILSAQMRVERIHQLVETLATTYGDPVEWRGETRYSFPSSTALAEQSERDLRDLGVGYRAPYLRETAAMIAADAISPASVATDPYETARETLTSLVGVGPKVADCVLLFSLGFAEPVPLDTWIRSAIEEHFPDAAAGSYDDTSRAIRDRFGPHPGYTQTYVFHHLRTTDRAQVGRDD
jgi:N-glycosylase/DNA lyase